eukprot:7379694-Prymnesium_polylepis.1
MLSLRDEICSRGAKQARTTLTARAMRKRVPHSARSARTQSSAQNHVSMWWSCSSFEHRMAALTRHRLERRLRHGENHLTSDVW